MTIYRCWDESGVREEFEAASAQAAAEEYVTTGSWGDGLTTRWHTIWVVEDGDAKAHDVVVHPPEPACGGEGHRWESPHAIVGGVKENPGVHGHGGGVVIDEVCLACGWARRTDTWAQRQDTGQQGLESVSYSRERYEEELQAFTAADE